MAEIHVSIKPSS